MNATPRTATSRAQAASGRKTERVNGKSAAQAAAKPRCPAIPATACSSGEGRSGSTLTTRAGIDTSDLIYSGRANTANGTVRTALVNVDELALGPFQDRDVQALVNEGDMETSLLGMAYLQRFERLEISGGTLVLER